MHHLFVSLMTKTERQVIELSHASAWEKNIELATLQNYLSGHLIDLLQLHLHWNRRHHVKKGMGWGKWGQFQLREVKRGWKEFQLLVLFKLVRCFIFGKCIPISHTAPTALSRLWWVMRKFDEFNATLFQASYMSWVAVLEWNVLEDWVGPLRNAVGQMWIQPLQWLQHWVRMSEKKGKRKHNTYKQMEV